MKKSRNHGKVKTNKKNLIERCREYNKNIKSAKKYKFFEDLKQLFKEIPRWKLKKNVLV